MTILREPRATLRERWLQRARETPLVLSNGLMVHGAATGLERRFEHFIGDYLGPGRVETRPGMTVFDIDGDIDMRPVRE
jgi:hypothetical protein